jgi:hypothetical protein
VPSRLREAAHTCEFREVLHRGPKIAACLLERGGFEPPSPFRVYTSPGLRLKPGLATSPVKADSLAGIRFSVLYKTIVDYRPTVST